MVDPEVIKVAGGEVKVSPLHSKERTQKVLGPSGLIFFSSITSACQPISRSATEERILQFL